MQSSQTSATGSGTSGLSSESEDIPSYSYTSGVTESYRNWDGADSPLVDGTILASIFSILAGVLVLALVAVVIAAVVLGTVYFVKQRKAKKAGVSGAEYVLMENDMADLP